MKGATDKLRKLTGYLGFAGGLQWQFNLPHTVHERKRAIDEAI